MVGLKSEINYKVPDSVDTAGRPPPSSRIPDNKCPWPLKDVFCEMWMDDRSMVERDWAFHFAHHKAMGKSEVGAYDAATHHVLDDFLLTTAMITKEFV